MTEPTIAFTCKLAGVNIGIRCLHPATQKLCRDYLTAEAPDFTVTTSQENIDYEREQSAKTSLEEFGRVIPYSDGYLETLAVYRQIAQGMLDYDTILFHGSAICVDGQAYLFTARSGTGKSTHTRLWRERFGDRAYMVNDDKPLIRITPEAIYVCGTPWDGKHHLSRNTMVPLKALCRLERGQENCIAPLFPTLMFPTALQQAYLPPDEASMKKALSLLEALVTRVGCYRLQCNMDPEAAQVSYEGMQ